MPIWWLPSTTCSESPDSARPPMKHDSTGLPRGAAGDSHPARRLNATLSPPRQSNWLIKPLPQRPARRASGPGAHSSSSAPASFGAANGHFVPTTPALPVTKTLDRTPRYLAEGTPPMRACVGAEPRGRRGSGRAACEGYRALMERLTAQALRQMQHRTVIQVVSGPGGDFRSVRSSR